jgi:tetratricopeptide (TPR) repeat protein
MDKPERKETKQGGDISVLMALQSEVLNFWHLRSTVEPAARPYLKDCVGYFVCLAGGTASSSPSSSAAATNSTDFSADELKAAETRFNTITSTIIQLEPRHLPSEDRDKSMQAAQEGSHHTSAELQQKLVDTIEEGIDVSDKSKSDAYAYLGDLYKREKEWARAGEAYEKAYRLNREHVRVELIPYKLKMIAYMYFLHEDHEGLEYTRSIAYGDELLTECSTIFGLDSVEFALAEVFVSGISKSARGLSMELSHLLSDATSTLVYKLGIEHELTKNAQEDLRAVRTLIQYQRNSEKEKKARSLLLPRLGLVHGYDILTRSMEIKLNNTDMHRLQEVVSSGEARRRGEIDFVDFELSYDHPKLEWYSSAELRRQLEREEGDSGDEDGTGAKGNTDAHVEKLVRSLRKKRGGGGHSSAHNREGLLILNGGEADFADDESALLQALSPGEGVGVPCSPAPATPSPVFSLISRSGHVHPAGMPSHSSGSGSIMSGMHEEGKETTPGGSGRVRQNRLGVGRGRVGMDPTSLRGPLSDSSPGTLLDKVRLQASERQRAQKAEELRQAEETRRERRGMEPISLESWQSVADWLRDHGEHDAARAVCEQKLSGRIMLKLDHRGWKELGVIAAADRAKLMLACEDYFIRTDSQPTGPQLAVASLTAAQKGHGAEEEGASGLAGRLKSICIACVAFICCAEREASGRRRDRDDEDSDSDLSLDPQDEDLAQALKMADMQDAPGFKTSRAARELRNANNWGE